MNDDKTNAEEVNDNIFTVKPDNWDTDEKLNLEQEKKMEKYLPETNKTIFYKFLFRLITGLIMFFVCCLFLICLGVIEIIGIF